MHHGGPRHGFTLVELLIVIVVIAILAAISIVAYNGITQRAYHNRATSELSSIAKAVALYRADKGEYPADVSRNIPVGIFDYSGDVSDKWPTAPWSGSVYDYDHFVGSDGEPVVQISIRFCPLDQPVSACQFPSDSWADDFDQNSSAYWCITGICRAHKDQPDDHPAHCMNCRDD